MSERLLHKRVWVVCTVLAAGAALIGYATNLAWSLPTGGMTTSEVPGCVNLKDVTLEIVAVTFVKEFEGASKRFKESEPEKYRGAVVTLRIKKPKNFKLCLYAADLPLHYHYGKEMDVSPCFGLSSFSTQQEQDRLMRLFARSYGRTVTGLASTKSETVYVDLFYQNVEPNTADVHVLLARPSGASFLTKGWEVD